MPMATPMGYVNCALARQPAILHQAVAQPPPPPKKNPKKTHAHDDLHNLVPEQGREAQHRQDDDGNDPGPRLPGAQPVGQRAHPALKVGLVHLEEDDQDEDDGQDG